MRLFEALGVKSADAAASVAAHNYLSDRSAALLLRSRPDQLDIGSAVAVRIGERRLLATAAHNISGLDLSQIEAVPAGRRPAERLPLREARAHPLAERENVDVAWLEIDSTKNPPGLSFIELSQIIGASPTDDLLPCLVQGYPAKTAEVPRTANESAVVESDGFLTLTIGVCRRRSPGRPEVDFAIEYPPHDGSLDDIDIPPPGLSCGGIFLFPPFKTGRIWSPEGLQLLGISRGWWKAEKELVATRIDRWLTLVAEDFPDIRAEIEDALGVESTGGAA